MLMGEGIMGIKQRRIIGRGKIGMNDGIMFLYILRES
jgi:hypothetical protein